ncbi:glycoside hydrolase family 2 protein [uncultured Caballeronia sp.]|uniref:glycosyl hydrolase 2 galactose-binding domain-containing protein n=1 Tax=uncultured Caballeronia sp. TaxID=1827198 RepID=UPI001577266A
MRVITPGVLTPCSSTPAEPTPAVLTPASYLPQRLSEGWQCISTPAGAYATPAELPSTDNTAHWIDAPVPGTVASAWRAAGKLDMESPPAFAFDDHWYRLVLSGQGARRVRLNGLATICEVWLDDTKLLDTDSMFEAHDIDINLDGHATLYLCFRSLTAALGAKRGRARWRPRLAQPATLRNVRTTLLGHMPGWCPSVQAAGPWRAVQLLGESATSIDRVDLQSSLDGDDGIVHLTIRFVHPQAYQAARVMCRDSAITLQWQDAQTISGTLRVPDVPRWWPHTHGDPALHEVTLEFANRDAISLGRIGFREITVDRGPAGDGFQLVINGVPVFARGACWTTADLVSLDTSAEQAQTFFRLARDAGMNMLRVGGTMLYESDAFYALADEHGLLIWQDFAFANFDYPTDPAFKASTQREAEQFLSRTQRFASLAVLCGGSEADQQAAMLGLPPAMRTQTLFTEQLPSICAAKRPDVPYVVNSPSIPASDDSENAWPFATRAGITHYYGVGAYQRPLDDARRANVRFASECLAFANVPDDVALNAVPLASMPHQPRWKAAVPRDPGASWDFDDVREHYLRALYSVDPLRLRYEDPERYLALSRAVVAEVMGEVFSEWRRQGSSCAGGIVWQLQDIRAGAGWGLIDALGTPKSALHGLAHVLRPVTALITDEGLDGLDIHLINETARPINAHLELVCLRDGATKVASASRDVTLSPRSNTRLQASDVLGQFFDFTYAYRFGPRAHEATVITLRDKATGAVLSEAFHFPERELAQRHDLGFEVRLEHDAQGEWELVMHAKRLARWVHVVDPHYRARDEWFHLAPGVERRIALVARERNTSHTPQGEVRALNATFSVQYQRMQRALSARAA